MMQPINQSVLVIPDDLPPAQGWDKDNEEPIRQVYKGRVVEVGQGRWNPYQSEWVPVPVSRGQWIIFRANPKWIPRFYSAGNEYILIAEEDVLAIVERDTEIHRQSAEAGW